MSFDANADDLTIGVIGAGAMGQGIVQVSLQGGMKVVLFDANMQGASAGEDLIFQRLVLLLVCEEKRMKEERRQKERRRKELP